MKTAVIGVGYLGKFHAEKFAQLPDSELVAVCDIDRARCNEIAKQLDTQAIYDYQQLLGQVDVVSIAVPTALHHPIAKFFLQNKVHVLVEKPITSTVAQADDLIRTAKQAGVLLQVGHMERFNPVFNALETVLDNPRFIDSVRLAPFKPRGTDINVVLDLMIHDIDIIQQMVKSPIIEIRANGAHVLSNSIDIANARLQFANGCVANVTASRVSFKAERKCRIFQHDAYHVVDFQNKKLAIHKKGTSEMFPGIPDILSEEQAFDQKDALQDEIIAFLSSIKNSDLPTVSGLAGRNALATAIEITKIVTSQLQKEIPSIMPSEAECEINA